jgi:hypothetical protein
MKIISLILICVNFRIKKSQITNYNFKHLASGLRFKKSQAKIYILKIKTNRLF